MKPAGGDHSDPLPLFTHSLSDGDAYKHYIAHT